MKPPTHTRRSAWNAAKRTTWRPSTGLHSFRHQQNPASMRRNGFKVGTCPHDTRDPFSTGSKSTRAFASAPFPVQGLDCAFWQLGRPRPAHFRAQLACGLRHGFLTSTRTVLSTHAQSCFACHCLAAKGETTNDLNFNYRSMTMAGFCSASEISSYRSQHSNTP